MTLSQQLSWSHIHALLLPIKYPLTREFYAEMCRVERWCRGVFAAAVDVLGRSGMYSGRVDA